MKKVEDNNMLMVIKEWSNIFCQCTFIISGITLSTTTPLHIRKRTLCQSTPHIKIMATT